jgi:hypothetical protein
VPLHLAGAMWRADATFTHYHHPGQVTASREWQSQFDRDMKFLERRQRARRSQKFTFRLKTRSPGTSR